MKEERIMWRVVMQLVVVGVLLTRVATQENSANDHQKNKKMFDLLCALFTKAEKGAKENYIDKLKDDSNYQWFNKGARDSAALKTEADKVKELESKVQSHENNARTAFRKAAYGDHVDKEDADKTFGSHGENQPCNPESGWTTIPKDIICLCNSVGWATDYCPGSESDRKYGNGGTAEDGLQTWNGIKGKCTSDSGSAAVTVDAIRKDLEVLRGLYPKESEEPAPPPLPEPPGFPPPPPVPEKKPDKLASKPWVQKLNEATDHMKERDEALQQLREQVKKLRGTYGAAKNEEEVKALKESGAGAEGAQPSRTAPQTAARKDSDAQPTQTQTQKQNIASFPSLKITLLSVSLCFI
ncbi:hypothetical protein, conserved [Trypanosoma brucei gambiense DAL972]|uniref:Trypanosome variant surface glycoprotein B-type N-terminal domain-containing protein n=1 Tax=Trypanosoma brucei gambiense (strain MHOM/CI/86/DAL972) TaxID=679716 RepID=C9ZQE5_TRYB9|nr:hypothetical protein, conserved [Trypanosoma brucei gambiense DAL972]CBH11625.1 hypothetical protein, conserved [Trypanosoma brucei gambiense DAL972]|eukprot:XP_011773910.1 hypothetical protein, conserved [Trypanosoma brucei gambiense DAL972]